MAKEAKEYTLTAQYESNGINMTIQQVVPAYDIEDANNALCNLVKLLAKGDALLVTTE